MTTPRAVLEAFFAAENGRNWERYAEFLHPDVEWVVNGRSVRGRAAYLEAMVAAYEDTDAEFRMHQVIESSDGHHVLALLVDTDGNRSVDAFEFEGALIRREWEFLLGPGRDWTGDVVEFRSGLTSGGKR